MKNKRGDSDKTILIQVILIVIVMALFVFSSAKKIDGKGVRQDIIESQMAMAIGAGTPGMTFKISKINANGLINEVKVEDDKIFISMDGLRSAGGHSYFSVYDVEVEEDKGKFLVAIK